MVSGPSINGHSVVHGAPIFWCKEAFREHLCLHTTIANLLRIRDGETPVARSLEGPYADDGIFRDEPCPDWPA
jgi:hypothetical protein